MNRRIFNYQVDIKNQCKKAKVDFFFKQWGGVRKSQAGRELDGKTYDAMPSLNQKSNWAKERKIA